MGRKEFMRDLKDATEEEFPDISNVHRGEDDGAVACTSAFTVDGSTTSVDLVLLVLGKDTTSMTSIDGY